MPIYNGTSGDDVFDVINPQNDDEWYGGAGTDTIHLVNAGFYDIYSLPDITADSIEILELSGDVGDLNFIQIGHDQLSVFSQITGSAGLDAIEIYITGGGDYTIPTLTLNNWNNDYGSDFAPDYITIFPLDDNDYILRANENTNGEQDLVGAGGNDVLYGHSGFDILLGGGGTDQGYGYAGDDAIILQNRPNNPEPDQSGEFYDGGDDEDYLSAFGDIIGGTYTNIENINVNGAFTLSGGNNQAFIEAGNYDGSGRIIVELDTIDAIDGSNITFETYDFNGFTFGSGSGANLIFEFRGNGNANSVIGTSTADELFGFEGDDTLSGNDGNDILDGGTGKDDMTGGFGDDIYYVDTNADQIFEGSSQGIDLIYTTAAFFVMGAGVENITILSGGGNAVGNGIANVVTGDAGDNALYGNGGADTLIGGAGNDRLSGGTTALDNLQGGEGDDFYYVNDTLDVVIELASEGNDTIRAGVNYTLGDNIENLLIVGTATDGTGNELDNVIRGQSRANTLYGLDGDDRIYGNNGDDELVGGLGADILFGGSGSDTFTFAGSAFSGLTVATADRIADFSQGQGDMIDLSGVDAQSASTGSDDAFTFIGDAVFSGTAGELRYQQFGSVTNVYGDTDGDGSADFLIRLNGVIDLTVTDFIL